MVKSCGCDWQWVPSYSVIYGNVIELWVMETKNTVVTDSASLPVVLFTEMPLSYELWKLKTAKMCFQFPYLITQKLENWVMETELSYAKRILSYGSYYFWVMSYGNWEWSYRNRSSKQPLNLTQILALCFFKRSFWGALYKLFYLFLIIICKFHVKFFFDIIFFFYYL